MSTSSQNSGEALWLLRDAVTLCTPCFPPLDGKLRLISKADCLVFKGSACIRNELSFTVWLILVHSASKKKKLTCNVTLNTKSPQPHRGGETETETERGLLNIITDAEMIVSFRRLHISSMSSEEKEVWLKSCSLLLPEPWRMTRLHVQKHLNLGPM